MFFMKLAKLIGPVCGNSLLRPAVTLSSKLVSPCAVSNIRLFANLNNNCHSCAILTHPHGQTLRNYSLFIQTPKFDLTKLLTSAPVIQQQVRTYKARVVLKRRCKGCYFEKREGRWYVECTLKPRHKQMQKMHKKDLYRDDYSKGNIQLAAHWGWRKRRFYWQGDNTPRDLYKPLIDYNSTSVRPPV